MRHLLLVIATIGRLEAIRKALDYDLGAAGISPELTGAAAVLWRTNMRAWRLAALEES